jgi:hypothetical protein
MVELWIKVNMEGSRHEVQPLVRITWFIPHKDLQHQDPFTVFLLEEHVKWSAVPLSHKTRNWVYIILYHQPTLCDLHGSLNLFSFFLFLHRIIMHIFLLVYAANFFCFSCSVYCVFIAFASEYI